MESAAHIVLIVGVAPRCRAGWYPGDYAGTRAHISAMRAHVGDANRNATQLVTVYATSIVRTPAVRRRKGRDTSPSELEERGDQQ